ncbi:hypothetical protein PENSPDRAFT_672696, partial [Peniophora sp. CONT]
MSSTPSPNAGSASMRENAMRRLPIAARRCVLYTIKPLIPRRREAEATNSPSSHKFHSPTGLWEQRRLSPHPSQEAKAPKRARFGKAFTQRRVFAGHATEHEGPAALAPGLERIVEPTAEPQGAATPAQEHLRRGVAVPATEHDGFAAPQTGREHIVEPTVESQGHMGPRASLFLEYATRHEGPAAPVPGLERIAEPTVEPQGPLGPRAFLFVESPFFLVVAYAALWVFLRSFLCLVDCAVGIATSCATLVRQLVRVIVKITDFAVRVVPRGLSCGLDFVRIVVEKAVCAIGVIMSIIDWTVYAIIVTMSGVAWAFGSVALVLRMALIGIASLGRALVDFVKHGLSLLRDATIAAAVKGGDAIAHA